MTKKDKVNYFSYKVSGNTVVHSHFNIYQSKSGAIYMLMGAAFTQLTLKQINELGIDVYSLLDYNHDDFQKAYAEHNMPSAKRIDSAQLAKAEPKLIRACRSALEYLDILYPDKSCCHPKGVIDEIKMALDQAGVVDTASVRVVDHYDMTGSDKKYRCSLCNGVATALAWNRATLFDFGGKIDCLESNEAEDDTDFTCPVCLHNSYKKEIIGPIKTYYAIAMENEFGHEEYLREESGDDCFSDDIGNAILYQKPTQCTSLIETAFENNYIVIVEKDEEGCLCVFGKYSGPAVGQEDGEKV